MGLFKPYKKVSTTMFFGFKRRIDLLFKPYKKVSTTISDDDIGSFLELFKPYKKVSTTIDCRLEAFFVRCSNLIKRYLQQCISYNLLEISLLIDISAKKNSYFISDNFISL